ncbi:MAG: CPBP family intramembrane metalloprotease [bacterium]|jgi:membrane protease YdiL (CAAX protease family)|nr:CPBP family intramembrane metalloprotease [bacterium]
MKNKNIFWWYLVIVFILSYLWQYLMFLTGGVESKLFPFMMWFPALVAIAFRLITKEGFRNVGWGLRKWWYILPALIVPLIVILGVAALLISLNWATLAGKLFTFKAGMVDIQKVRLLLGNHTQTISFFAMNLIFSIFAQSVPGCIFTLGEEFGWRGYVQEKFLKRFGLNRGLILLGAIWGYWHLPIILMGWNFPNHPVLGSLLLMPIGTIFLGIFLGWIYLRSRSIWLPALAHASINLCAILLFTEIAMQQHELFQQLMWIAAWGIVAVPCLISLNRKKPILWQNATISAE